ncbi:MAG: type I DNA topoisomerase [Paludibacteraceae bacterium]|nr:type I DNA topoisomerase [Paludibacteraceae bacterium]
MSKNLVIVESPAKAKTIGKYLGKDYTVMSSMGHIRDIEGTSKKDSMGIDFQHGYAPNYVIERGKGKLVKEMTQEAKKADTVWLASDEDREGEAIAWHLQQVLNLNDEKTKRIVFHEITKEAILHAVENPRKIDLNLVDAQQARRVLDRIVGFELSPILWRKVKPSLSAGRVQSVAVRLIVDREREIQAFKPEASFRITAVFDGKDAEGHDISLKAELNHRFSSKQEANDFLQQCAEGKFQITDIHTKPAHRSPAPPFTTSTLQQEASRKLGLPVAVTMRLAQSLYEEGNITYMRTDSVNLSSLALGTAKKTITEEFGEMYHKARQYHTTSAGAQEAHEAIRPTYIDRPTAGKDEREKRLYDLIRKRTIASQMADAQLEKTTITISDRKSKYHFVAQGETILFDGFLKVYRESNEENEEAQEATLPKMKNGEPLTYNEIEALERFSLPPARYSEASLVKKMEELGIGRPSTYATIISTIQQRDYVERGNKDGQKRECVQLKLKKGKITEKLKAETFGADKGKMLPTDIGMVVTDFLKQYFAEIVNYNFTAEAEQQFDHVAEGKEKWTKVVDKFYKEFHPLIDSAKTDAPVQKGERLLGNDPETGKPVLVKIGRFGLMAQKGNASETDKPQFATLKKGQTLENITLEQALDLFRLPRVVGQYEDADVVANNGKFGPYIMHQKKFYTIPKGTDPLEISLDEAISIIENKREAEKPIHDFGDIKVLNGRYGAYIQADGKNYKIDKKTDAKLLTEDDCKKIIETTEPTGAKKSNTHKASKVSKTSKAPKASK